MNKKTADTLLSSIKFKVAETMPTMPHEYNLRDQWSNSQEFDELVGYINNNSVSEKYKGKYYKCYYANGFKYWALKAPSWSKNRDIVCIINRTRVEPVEDKSDFRGLNDIFGF
jgi:hypothetical protein